MRNTDGAGAFTGAMAVTRQPGQRWGGSVKTFKRHERAVAAMLGGRRVGNSGRNTEDVAHDWLTVECKSRKTLPDWSLDCHAPGGAQCASDGHAVARGRVAPRRRPCGR